MLCFNLSDIVIITVEGVDYLCITHGIRCNSFVSNNSFILTVITSQFYRNRRFIRPNYQNQKTNFYQTQKDCHQDNLPFAFLQSYKHNCLNIPVVKICFHKKNKESIKMILKD